MIVLKPGFPGYSDTLDRAAEEIGTVCCVVLRYLTAAYCVLHYATLTSAFRTIARIRDQRAKSILRACLSIPLTLLPPFLFLFLFPFLFLFLHLVCAYVMYDSGVSPLLLSMGNE
jgi:hypothetical protein